jgi:hypothetical protein
MSDIKLIPADVRPCNFKLYLKDEDIEFLMKHDFSGQVKTEDLTKEDMESIVRFAKIGLLQRFRLYTTGTEFYKQLKETQG